MPTTNNVFPYLGRATCASAIRLHKQSSTQNALFYCMACVWSYERGFGLLRGNIWICGGMHIERTDGVRWGARFSSINCGEAAWLKCIYYVRFVGWCSAVDYFASANMPLRSPRTLWVKLEKWMPRLFAWMLRIGFLIALRTEIRAANNPTTLRIYTRHNVSLARQYINLVDTLETPRGRAGLMYANLPYLYYWVDRGGDLR